VDGKALISSSDPGAKQASVPKQDYRKRAGASKGLVTGRK
jgi:hypothetical protein